MHGGEHLTPCWGPSWKWKATRCQCWLWCVPARCRTEHMGGSQGHLCMWMRTYLSWHLCESDLSSFLCVHRAIFTYDGFTNKLKLADSGGKNNHHLISARPSHAVRTFTLSPPLWQPAAWKSWQPSFTSLRPSMGFARWRPRRQEPPRSLWSAGWVAQRMVGWSWVEPAQMMRREKRRFSHHSKLYNHSLSLDHWVSSANIIDGSSNTVTSVLIVSSYMFSKYLH